MSIMHSVMGRLRQQKAAAPDTAQHDKDNLTWTYATGWISASSLARNPSLAEQVAFPRVPEHLREAVAEGIRTALQQALQQDGKDGLALVYVPQNPETEEISRLAVERGAMEGGNIFMEGGKIYAVLNDPKNKEFLSLWMESERKRLTGGWAPKYVPQNPETEEISRLAVERDATGEDLEPLQPKM